VQQDAASDGFGFGAVKDLGRQATGRTRIDDEIRHGESPLNGSLGAALGFIVPGCPIDDRQEAPKIRDCKTH